LFEFVSIAQYHRDLLNNSTTCKEAVEFYLEQIQNKKSLNAFSEVFAEEALALAFQLDNERRNGATIQPLHGVVIGIKDVLCYKGHKVTAASLMLKNYEATYYPKTN
jgi:aspartyl-tRNA(Asn)/glutamyl-tRNA(Gln) amidotransferase subunit A